MIVHIPILFLFLKQYTQMILYFSNNELITLYESECVPSNSIWLDMTQIVWYDTRYDFPSHLSHSTFYRIMSHGHYTDRLIRVRLAPLEPSWHFYLRKFRFIKRLLQYDINLSLRYIHYYDWLGQWPKDLRLINHMFSWWVIKI